MIEQDPRPTSQIEMELDELIQNIQPEASFTRRLRAELLEKAETTTRQAPSPGRIRWQRAWQWGLGLAGLALLVGMLVFSIGLLPQTPLSPAVTPGVRAIVPATSESPTPVPTLDSSPQASAVETQPAPTSRATPTVQDGVERIASPDGRWAALLDRQAGSLDVVDPQGSQSTLFSPGSTASAASWSPNSQKLVVVLGNWPEKAPNAGTKGLLEIWLATLEGDTIGAPALLYRPQETTGSPAATGGQRTPDQPDQILLGAWSPDGRRLLFWLGPLSASIAADGLPLWSLEVPGGQAAPLSQATLVNPAYQSWAPDGSALAFTDGGYRSAQVGKWLARYDVASGQVSTLVPQEKQVPGALAWSPQGGQIAYAAVEADQTGPDLADWMGWDNRAILARRIYLLDVQSGVYQRLNQAGGYRSAETYQDAPRWSADGKTLYYVQMDGDQAQIMAADPASGAAEALTGCRAPLPSTAGYYGQVDWSSLYAACPATQAPALGSASSLVPVGSNAHNCFATTYTAISLPGD